MKFKRKCIILKAWTYLSNLISVNLSYFCIERMHTQAIIAQVIRITFSLNRRRNPESVFPDPEARQRARFLHLRKLVTVEKGWSGWAGVGCLWSGTGLQWIPFLRWFPPGSLSLGVSANGIGPQGPRPDWRAAADRRVGEDTILVSKIGFRSTLGAECRLSSLRTRPWHGHRDIRSSASAFSLPSIEFDRCFIIDTRVWTRSFLICDQRFRTTDSVMSPSWMEVNRTKYLFIYLLDLHGKIFFGSLCWIVCPQVVKRNYSESSSWKIELPVRWHSTRRWCPGSIKFIAISNRWW